MARWCKSWSGLVLCFIALHQQVSGADTPDVVAVFSDTAIAAAIDAAVAAQPAAIGVITAADLPKTRPPFPTAEGYNFCDYTCATKIIVKAGDQTSGVLYVEVRYKPLAGVTAAMMQWLFNSLTGTAKYYGNGKTYPMYLIFHPRDHVFHLASKLPVAAGVTDFTWCEMILTNCKYNRRSATKPWTCPATARGYVQSTPASRYDTKLQTKEVLSVSRFDGRGIEFNRAVNLADYGLSGNRTVATTRHTWSNTARGLSLRTQLWIGLMVEGSNTQFDTGFIGSAAKNQIINSYVGGATNINNKNMTQVGWMNALHFLEEYGGLKNWLPQVYAGRTRK